MEPQAHGSTEEDVLMAKEAALFAGSPAVVGKTKFAKMFSYKG